MLTNRFIPTPCSITNLYLSWVAVWEKAAEKSEAVKVVAAGSGAADPKIAEAALVQKALVGKEDDQTNVQEAAHQNAGGERPAHRKVAAEWAATEAEAARAPSKKATLKPDAAAKKANGKGATVADKAEAP